AFREYFISLIIGVLTISIRFFNALIAQGFDTPVYVYSARLIDRGDIYVMLSSTKPVAFLLSWIVFKLSGNSVLLTGFLLPYIFGCLFLVLTIKAVKIGYHDNRLALIIGSITALSYTFIRITYDLYAQTLGLGVLYITLIAIARFYEAENQEFMTKTKEVGASLLLLYMCHFYTAALVTIFFLIIFMLKIMKSRKERRYISIKRILLIVFLSGFVSISFIILRWDSIVWLLTIVIPNEFKFFGVTLDSFWFFKQDCFIFWIGAIIGLYAISIRKNPTDVILGLWGLFIIMLTIITGYVQTYRFLLLIPAAFYAGIGLEYAHTVFSSGDIFKKYNLPKWFIARQKVVAVLFVLIFFALLEVNAIQKGYIPQYVYYPNREVESQLIWMERNFGFNNQSIIVPVFAPHNKNYLNTWTANIEGWSLAYLGTVIFRGSALELVSGVQNVYENQYTPGEQKIVLADKLYHLGPVEKYFSTEIYPGIYLFNATIEEIETFIKTNNAWLKNSFDNSSISLRDTLNASIIANETLSIGLSEGYQRGSITITFKGIGLYIRGFNSLIMNISGNLLYTTAYVKLRFADGTCINTKLEDIANDRYMWRVVPIFGYRFLTDIEITLVRVSNINYPTENIFIGYLAIV
ncbi:MAG: hypothetical protein J7L47_03845, partial [Candidatus Odinarchaeota archaeon]|nr:hypothetical protein [Candidatus Odinarchaeota archaeon]